MAKMMEDEIEKKKGKVIYRNIVIAFILLVYIFIFVKMMFF